MRPALNPLDAALADLRALVAQVEPTSVPPAAAAGLIAADYIVLADALPPTAIALLDGVAVLAAETVGASPQGPVFLAAAPRAVRMGEPLPEGADAVLPAGALDMLGGLPMLLQQAFPGEGARLTGRDLPAGTSLVAAGGMIGPSTALALELAGHRTVSVRQPVVRLDIASPTLAAWLADFLARFGARVAKGSEPAHLDVTDRQEGFSPRIGGLALSPGQTAATGTVGIQPAILLPPRIDGAIAAAVALLPTALAALSGFAAPAVIRPLLARLTSQAGLAEIALLSLEPEGFRPLASGDIPLASLIAASHAAVIPAESEGMPAGDSLAALSLPGTPG